MIEIETSVYTKFNEYSKYIVIWQIIFGFIISVSLGYKIISQKSIIFNKSKLSDTKLLAHKDNVVLEELGGFPLIFIHTLCFCMASHWITKMYFLYWGPIYFIVAFLVLTKAKINWKPFAIPSSIACKLFYIGYVGIFWSLSMYLPIYCYSLWIMTDQVKLAWWKSNADRTRRFSEDYYIFRIGYPLGLLITWTNPDTFANIFAKQLINLCVWSKIISILILIGWIGGIVRLVWLDKFFVKPEIAKIGEFGRDIVYL